MTTSEVFTSDEKLNTMLENASAWLAYYRANVHRFATEILGLEELKPFQKVCLYQMNEATNFMFLASRGLGKTYLTSLFCICRCILYPDTHIAVASKTREQGNEVIEKIKSIFLPKSTVVQAEIAGITLTSQKGLVEFYNGSRIFVVTSTDSARHSRANILIVDEFRMVDANIIQTVLRKFLTASRQPPYLSNPKYKHLMERNKEVYMSSCWYASHWSYEKARAYFANMLDAKRKYYICALPYQIAIKENLLFREAVEDEMSEADFNEVAFSMEMEAKWFRDSEGSLYSYESISKTRRIKYPYLPSYTYKKLPDKRFKIPDKVEGEFRVLSVDVALMKSKSKENDATSIFLNQAMPSPSNDNKYFYNITYTENQEGMLTEDLALKIRRLEYEFDCDILAIDCKGLGFGVVEYLLQSMVDPDTGFIYPALSCINDDAIAERCREKNAEKKIWAIQGTAQLNSDCALILRECIRTGKIRTLVSEYDAEENLREIHGFNNLSSVEKLEFQLPYINTSLLTNELISLQYETKNQANIRVQEKSGMRKDRYSSLSYNCYVASQLEMLSKKKKKEKINTQSIVTHFKKPKLYNRS